MAKVAFAQMSNMDVRVMTLGAANALSVNVTSASPAGPPAGLSIGVAASPNGPVLALTLATSDGAALATLLDAADLLDFDTLMMLARRKITDGAYAPLAVRQ